MRVAIIGSGVVGASVGWHLARRGAQVVMIDGGPAGAGVTDWSFSWVGASNIVLEHHRRTGRTALSVSDPTSPERAQADGKSQTRAYFDLTVAGMAAHRELASALGDASWWHPTGHLRWFDDVERTEQLRGVIEHLTSWGYDVAFWDAGSVRRILEPDIRFLTDDTEVAFYRDEGWIDGRGLVRILIDDIVSNDGEVHFGRPVTDVIVNGDRVVEVILADGRVHKVDAIVNATGPAGDQIARLVRRALPMIEERGLVARVRCDHVPIRRAMHAPHVELRPDRAGQVALHSREIDALIERADVADLAARLQALAIDVAPALSTSELIDARIAWRPIPGDGFPSVGGINAINGYYEAITHGGITLGAIIGRALTQEIIEGTVDELIQPYLPDRFTDTTVNHRA